MDYRTLLEHAFKFCLLYIYFVFNLAIILYFLTLADSTTIKLFTAKSDYPLFGLKLLANEKAELGFRLALVCRVT